MYCGPLGRSETDIVNVVEQRIWHSMEEGHFENLPGKGRPLNLNSNPHVDPAEDTLYRILSRNGCAPEWVELNKEIRSKITEWRLALKKARAHKSDHEDSKWQDDSVILKAQMRDINDKVNHFRSIVLCLSLMCIDVRFIEFFLICIHCRFFGTISLCPLAVKCLGSSGRKK